MALNHSFDAKIFKIRVDKPKNLFFFVFKLCKTAFVNFFLKNAKIIGFFVLYGDLQSSVHEFLQLRQFGLHYEYFRSKIPEIVTMMSVVIIDIFPSLPYIVHIL